MRKPPGLGTRSTMAGGVRAARIASVLVAAAAVVMIAHSPATTAAIPGPAMPAFPAEPATPASPQHDETFRAAVNGQLGLARSSVFQPPMVLTSAEPAVLVMLVDDMPIALEIEPVSIRSVNYQVLAQQADGSLVEVEPGPVRTFRGKALGFPASTVSGSVLTDGMHLHVTIPGAIDYWIEPLAGRMGEGAADLYVGYRDEDVLSSGGICATDAEQMQVELPALIPGMDPEAGLGEVVEEIPELGLLGGADNCLTELACDADFEFFQAWGSVAGVEDRVNDIINAVNTQYEEEVGISHEITTIIVRTSEPDPYTATLASTLLDQFRNQWLNNHGGIQRDVAHLFTGKELDGSTIGIAWVSAVCTSHGYSLVESDFSANFACVTDVTAHELGHNWGASHCTCPSYTMNPSASCANQFDPAESIPEIVAFRDTRTCLDPCDDTAPLSCGDPAAGDCFVGHSTASCSDAACCNAVCAVDPGCCNDVWDAFCASQAQDICGGGGADDAPLDDVNITIGTLLDGNLASLDDGDDNHLRINSEMKAGKPTTRAVVAAISPHTVVSQLELVVETSANKNNVTTVIALYNYNKDKWVEQASFDQPLFDTVTTIDVVNPNKFVENETGQVRVRITQKRDGEQHFRCRIDHVQVTATP